MRLQRCRFASRTALARLTLRTTSAAFSGHSHPRRSYSGYLQALGTPDAQPRPADPSHGRYGIGNATWIGQPRIVSWKPMATVYDNFLTEEECDYLLKIATPKMEPAMLVNSEIQKHMKSKSRTSHGAFFDSFGDPIVAMITNRIGHVARIPPGTHCWPAPWH